MSLGNDIIFCPLCEGEKGHKECPICKGHGRTYTWVAEHYEKYGVTSIHDWLEKLDDRVSKNEVNKK